MIEEWRPVVGFEELYEVSNFGQVRSLARTYKRSGWWRNKSHTWTKPGKMLSPKSKYSYKSVCLYKHKRKGFTVFVHTLVLWAFVGPPPSPVHQCCHFDNNPANNTIDNLRWDTPIENNRDKLRHGTLLKGERIGNSKLTKREVEEIKRLHALGATQRSLAKQFKTSTSNLSLIVLGRIWQ